MIDYFFIFWLLIKFVKFILINFQKFGINDFKLYVYVMINMCKIILLYIFFYCKNVNLYFSDRKKIYICRYNLN